MSSSSLSWVGLAALSGVGCAGHFDPAHFQGSREARRAEPEAVLELAATTDELVTLGQVHDSCTLRPGFRRLAGESLSDLDCSFDRLRLTLRESAANAGGEVLSAVHCQSQRLGTTTPRAYQISCSAEVARYRNGPLANLRPLSAPRTRAAGSPAPSASDVPRIDEPDASLAFRIALDFEPAVANFATRPRPASEVHELSQLPLSHQPLGDLQASCEGGCDARALRYGVLIAAGRLGAPDVVGVRCFSSSSGDSCVGTLAAPERNEGF